MEIDIAVVLRGWKQIFRDSHGMEKLCKIPREMNTLCTVILQLLHLQ